MPFPIGEETEWQNYGRPTSAICWRFAGWAEMIRERLPAMGFDLTEEETLDFVRTMVVNLPEHCRNRLAGRS